MALIWQHWETPEYLVHGPVPDAADIARRMRKDVAEDLFDDKKFINTLLSLAHRYPNNRDWAIRALSRVMSPGKTDIFAGKYTGHLTDLENAFQKAVPDFQKRTEAIAQDWLFAWSSYGQPLTRAVGRASEPDLFVPEAHVVLIGPPDQLMEPPLTYADPLTNVVVFPAIEPTTPKLDGGRDPSPTAMSQLVWSLSQLNLELPRYSESMPWHQAEKLGALAMVPAVLTAQMGGEYAYLEPSHVEQALLAWIPSLPSPGLVAADLSQWWQVYSRRRPDFGLALQALGHTLSDML